MIHSCHQTSDAALELAVLGGVDERVDTAADEHQYHGEVIEPRGDREFYATQPDAKLICNKRLQCAVKSKKDER